MDMLSISHVSKSFGSQKVLDDLSFTVPEHTVYGFIGQNGAGKTTTMKMVLGLLKMDEGTIQVNGQNVKYGQNNTNKLIGYLPDVPEFYGFMSPGEYLALCGEITGMRPEKIRERSDELLHLVGLENSRKRIQGFSRGMKQRLGIAQALMNEPKLLICDEPTSALDPLGRKEILEILSSVREHTTVIFSTHILSDVERICDEIAFLHNGSVALHGTLEEIRHMHRDHGFSVEFLRPQDAETFAGQFQGGEPVSSLGLLYRGKTQEDMNAAMSCILQNGLCLQRIEMLEPTLESLFMEVIGK